MAKVYIAVGSNMGDRASLIQEASDRLAKTPGVAIKNKSGIYETDPAGHGGGSKYLNGVWEIETLLSARDLLGSLLGIENAMGRVRKERNEPRPIDLDILFYGDEIIEEPGLSVPHPRLHERWFVLKPLSELCPGWKHPDQKRTVLQMLEALPV